MVRKVQGTSTDGQTMTHRVQVNYSLEGNFKNSLAIDRGRVTVQTNYI